MKGEVTEIVDFLRAPERYRRLGAQIPHGVLLSGPPGSGKTLLARAVAGEAQVPFFSISASEFIEAIVGVGASRVRDLFEQAKKVAPAIVFIDELDSIGRSRGGSQSFGGNDEREQTLNQILTEMDGFTGTEGVVVLAATNRPEILDPALLRPGRFDRRVTVSPPDLSGRRQILAVHTRGVPLAPDVDLGALAASTPGMVGADLRNLVNEAALQAARRQHEQVGAADFADALEKIVLGTVRGIMLSPEERERTAFHESGHALLGMLTPGADPVRKVSIIPRGQALGVTFQSPEVDRYGYSEKYLRGRITGALGGRAAEEVVYADTTTGAESDLDQVSSIARQMVGRWGMSGAIGPVTVLPRGAGVAVRRRRAGHARARRPRGPPDRRRVLRRGSGDAGGPPRAARPAGARPARARDPERGRRLRRGGHRCVSGRPVRSLAGRSTVSRQRPACPSRPAPSAPLSAGVPAAETPQPSRAGGSRTAKSSRAAPVGSLAGGPRVLVPRLQSR